MGHEIHVFVFSLLLQLKNAELSNHYWRSCNIKPINSDGHSPLLYPSLTPTGHTPFLNLWRERSFSYVLVSSPRIDLLWDLLCLLARITLETQFVFSPHCGIKHPLVIWDLPDPLKSLSDPGYK